MPDSQGDPLLNPARQALAEPSARLRSRRRRCAALMPAWLERVQSLWPQRTSLPQLMFVPFAAQLLFAMLLVLGLSYRMAGQIINQLTRELGEQIGERVLQEINAQLSAPRQVNAINARLLSSGLISPGRLLELGPLLQTELEQFPGLGYVHLANPQGAYLAMARNQQTDQLELSRQGSGSGLRLLPVFTIGAQGQPLQQIRSEPFDARQTVWFQNAIRNPLALNGFSVPFGAVGRPSGVAGADIWPVQITRFLQNLQIGEGAAVYVVDQRGFLVGSSSPQKLYSIVDGRLVRQQAVQAADPLVRGMAQLMKPRFGDDVAERQSINGKPYMLVTRMWNDPSGLAWQVVVATPEDNYLAAAKTTLNTSALVVLLSFGATVLLSRGTAGLVSQPLRRVAAAADGMAKGDLDQRIQGSRVDEVNDLTLSFNSMAGQLRQSYGDLEALKDYQSSILESMPSGVITFSEEGVVRSANAAGCRILQCDSQQLLGSNLVSVFNGANAWLATQLQEVLVRGDGRQLLDVELVIGRHRVSANLMLQPLRDPRLGVIGVILLLEDISEEKRIKATITRYMDPLVADKLLRAGGDSLSGVEALATVCFTDIQAFTPLTEQLGPRATVDFLNRYFSLMVDCLRSERGMLDKFIGDAIMAVFGLPIPGDDDEDAAIRAAIAMQRSLATWNRERLEQGEKRIVVRMGLHTDRVVSGNIGSPKRMSYTLVGDGVNLAARLESANKFYGTRVLVSDATLQRTKGRYCSREVDLLRVRGRSTPVLVHEIMDACTNVDPGRIDAFLEHFRRGRQAYCSRDWHAAIAAFEMALDQCAEDRLSRLYLERCQHLQLHPPRDDWDGVWNLTG